MTFQELVVLLPCHGFEDFPLYLEGEAADGLLAAYTALWHPALIHAVRKAPAWRRTHDEGRVWQGCLVALPKVCQDDMPGYWLDDVRAQGATVLECRAPTEVNRAGATSTARDRMVAAALAQLDPPAPAVHESLVSDFLALGLCHLLTAVLTVQMRYTSMVDEQRFETLLVAAADSAVAGDELQTREKLQACFDCLAESKDHFYPVGAYLIDLTLTASTTLGAALEAELQRDVPMNLLISGRDALALHDQFPQTLAALRRGLDEGRVTLVGGEYCEDFRPPLATIDCLLRQLDRGHTAYTQALGRQPVIFGRRRYGLSPIMPQVLAKYGFCGALHFTLDDGRFPTGAESAFQWLGVDDTPLDVFGRVPLDAMLPHNILAFPRHMSGAMDMDHVAALCFAHWPDAASPWYRDLQRIHKYASVLGTFVTLEQFFDQMGMASRQERFNADEYQSPYLRQAVEQNRSDPLSRTVAENRQATSDFELSTVDALTTLMLPGLPAVDTDIVRDIDGAQPDNSRVTAASSDDAQLQAAAVRFAAALPRDDEPATGGFVVVNPYSFVRQIVVDTPQLNHPPAVDGPVEAVYELNGRRQVLVNVPPFGFAWIAGDSGQAWQAPRSKPLVENHILRNEHFEARIDPVTGGLQSVHMQGHRGNQLSQCLAMRLPLGDGDTWHSRRTPPEYAVMAADAVAITDAGPLTAAITARGRLLDKEGQTLARYEQTLSVARTNRLLRLDIQLDPAVECDGEPWQVYYASRFAWPDPHPEMHRGVALGRHPTGRRRIEAPHFLQWQSGSCRTTLLTGGLPYHQCVGDRQLDSLLIVKGEASRRFRLAVGFQMPSAPAAAFDFHASDLVVPQDRVPRSNRHAWLFRLDKPSVLVTRCAAAIDGRAVSGVRLRLLETAGRSVDAGLFAYRPLASVRKLDFSGRTLGELPIDGDRVMIGLGSHECTELELLWHDDRDD